MNLTFHHIYFTSGSRDCYKGNVAVAAKILHIGQNNNKTNAFIFCGLHSIFYLHPEYKKIYIGKHTNNNTAHKLAFSYEVQDTNQVVILKPQLSNDSQIMAESVFLIGGEEILTFL